MAAFSSLGVGSGLELENLVTQLVEIERQPITRIEKQQESYNNELSGLGQLASALSAIQTAASEMKPSSATTSYADNYTTYKANIINKDVANVEVKSGGKPVTGSYQLGVEQIATSHRVATTSTDLKSNTAFHAGTITLETGKYNADNNTFVADGSTKVSVDIKEGDTLATIRDKINSSGANVSATIISADDGEHLIFTARDTGSETTIRISSTDNPDTTADSTATANNKNLSSVFAFDPTQTNNADKKSATIASGIEDGKKFAGGTLKIQIGDSATNPIEVSISDDSDLSAVAEAINQALTGQNIQAKVETTTDGTNKSSLVFTKTDGTAISGLKISAENTGGTPGADKLDLAKTFSFTSNALSEEEQYGGNKAKDAIITLNGLTITKSSNLLTDVVEGLSIELYAPTKKDAATGKYETTTISVTTDKNTKVTESLDKFVKTFNEQIALINDLGVYDKEAKEVGILQGKSILRTSQNLLRTMISGNNGIQGSQYQNLAAIGVAFTKEGTLEFDSGKLRTALENDYEGVMGLIGNTINNVNSKLETFLGAGGSIENSKNSINTILSNLDNRKSALELRIKSYEARLRKQFTAMDTTVNKWNGMLSYIEQLVNSMNAANGANKK